MGIQNWSEDVILVDLPRELEEHHELQTVMDMVRQHGAKEQANTTTRQRSLHTGAMVKGNTGLWEEGNRKLLDHRRIAR